MILEKDNAAQCARMTKIRLTQQETADYEKQLQDLFGWMKELAEVDTTAVPETSLARAAYLRPDEPITDEPLAEALVAAFPAKEGHCAKVKKVL
ncbi:MAG: aspartyl/glutamyl-tRNA amidotransferase subunit C [Elusimicrobiaceae bacterium]|nr:aspartyl/glutamyl-tRNA amidotransferase subunit C [Elusimicrobiaceae bacterium]